MSLQVEQMDGDEIILESAQLRAKHCFNEAISLIEDNIERIRPVRRATAWLEAFNAACAKGDTEQAKKFMLAIDENDPSLFMAP